MNDVRVEERVGEPIVRSKPPEPCVMTIFGASGDLTARKLVPALYELARDRALPERFALVGFARQPLGADGFRARLEEAVARFARRKPIDRDVWRWLAERIDYVAGGYDDLDAFVTLGRRLAELERNQGIPGNRLYYLATPPDVSPPVLSHLRESGLVRKGAITTPWSRVVIEKPFGHDLESFRALDQVTSAALEERQTFRIDHYLGKETVQNLLVFRFGNAIFEPLWNRSHVDHVEITAGETIGVEGRGSFYDNTGVMRDVVQNHLLQILAFVAMEAPLSFGSDDIRDETARALRTLRPIEGADVAENTVPGQYRGYLQEPGVAPTSRTPTYAALRVHLDSWRWQDVPFYLRAGKRLRARVTEVAIHFRPVPTCLFRTPDVCQRLAPNVLRLRIQPDEGISLRFEAKIPGDELALGGVEMDFAYARGFQRPSQDAYERLILDCMRGHGTLFVRRDVVEQQWAFVTPILRAWETDTRPIPVYEPGSAGPREADELIARDGHRWSALEDLPELARG
jgi:glucose-6-phosphate 1-dehydrogenase